MLFSIVWTIPSENRVACLNAFGNMTPDDDLKDAGPDVKIVGRWHHLAGDAGVCIAECSNAGALNSFMLNWAPLCNITVTPVVEDAMARQSLQDKLYFTKKE